MSFLFSRKNNALSTQEYQKWAALCQKANSKNRPSSEKKENEQTETEKKRIQLIQQAFQSGNQTVQGELRLKGYRSLEPCYYQTKDGYVAEKDLRHILFLRPIDDPVSVLKYRLWEKDKTHATRFHLLRYINDYEWVQKTQKNLIVLDENCVYQITPQMTLEQIHAKHVAIKTAYLVKTKQKEAARKNLIKQQDTELPALLITNKSLWDKIIHKNRLAPKTQAIPSEFTLDATVRLNALYRYAGHLQNIREEKGYITSQDIRMADDKADLSTDLHTISPDIWPPEECRFEGLRFWADVILSRTWKYGSELLAAEGFTPQEIKAIQTHPALPLIYSYWENLAHPYIRDLRVVAFWRGEQNQPQIQSQKTIRSIPTDQHTYGE